MFTTPSQIPFVARKLGADRNDTIVGYRVSTREKKYTLSVVRPNAVSSFPSNTETKIVFLMDNAYNRKCVAAETADNIP